MASSSTLTLPSGRAPPELSKLRPIGFSSHEICFSENSLDDKYDDYVSYHLKTLAPKDKKLRELIPFFEAEKRNQEAEKRIQDAKKRIETSKRAFLKEEAEKIKRSLKGGEDDGSNKEEEAKIQVLVPIEVLETKAALTQLEVQSLTFKLWLRRIQLTRQEDKQRYNNLQDFERAIYSAQEVITKYRDFIQRRRQFNAEEFQQFVLYYEDHMKNSFSKALTEKEKSNFEMIEEDVMRFLSNWDRISALLGLQVDFLDRLEQIPPEDRDHLTLCDWIATFLQNNYETVGLTDRNSPSKELLVSIGFDPLSSVVETIMARLGNTQQHIDACDMAEIFIKDEFKYNILLSPVILRFPLQSNLTNTWFQLPGKTGGEENDEISVCQVNILNLVTEEPLASSIARSKLSDLMSKDDQNVVLFHGTDHLSACDILFRGIDLCQGRQKRDFSCGSGFYLTDNRDEALKWAKNTTAKPALLVFQINRRKYLDDADKLNLFENEQRWREIVASFRSGKRSAKTRKSLGAYDLIEGPVGTMRRNESTDDEVVFDPKHFSYQMCLVSDDFADIFRETLHSIIFLDIC